VLNAGHVLQASPVAPNYMQLVNAHIDKLSPFEHACLENMGFSEFTPEFRHTQWLVCQFGQ
jgi:hypothetical protein